MMLSPLRLPSRSTPATPPSTPTLSQLSRPPASSYFRSMPQRASIRRQITRTVTYASIARLSSDITSATRRMLSPTPPRGNTKENATVWSPEVAMPITPRKPLDPFGVSLSRARRTPDSPRRGLQHASFAYGLPSPPPTRRTRPSSVRLARLPIAPFAVSSPPHRTNPASGSTRGDHVVTPPSSEHATPVSAAHQVYLATPTSGRRIQHPLARSSPGSPLARKSSNIGLDYFKNKCNEEGTLLSAFRSVNFSLSSTCSFSDTGLDSCSSTVLQLYVAGRDVPAVFSTTSPLAMMIQQAREEQSPKKGQLSQPTVSVQPVSDVPGLRVAQTTRAPVVEMQVAQVEQWPEVLPGCIGGRGLRGVDGGATRSSESASVRRARPTRQPRANERMDRPQSTPPVSLRLSVDRDISVPTGIGPKFMPLMRTRSILSRLAGKAKVASPPAASLGVPRGATGGGSLVRSNTTGRRGASHLPRIFDLRVILTMQVKPVCLSCSPCGTCSEGSDSDHTAVGRLMDNGIFRVVHRLSWFSVVFNT
jgi:hypothetical protein